MSSRPAWATQQVPGQLGLYSETLSQKRKEGRKEGKKGGREGGRARKGQGLHIKFSHSPE
jgi:hypothetical protein